MKTPGSRALRALHSIELLETRVAPAAVSAANGLNATDALHGAVPQIVPNIPTIAANGLSATYTDTDGDLVTVKVSLGNLHNATFTMAPGPVMGEQLEELDLSAGGFDGAKLSITAKRAPGGDGLAAVGYIDSIGHDLSSVSIEGDLGRIDAGNGTGATVAIKTLSVHSIGRYGLATQAAGGSLESDIVGGLGTLTVAGDIDGALINVTNSTQSSGMIGSATIGGSLIGGSTANSGSIQATGDIGTFKGIAQESEATLLKTGKSTSVAFSGGITIHGSILGGAGTGSGTIVSEQRLAEVKVSGDLLGGSGDGSGSITASNGATAGELGLVSIGGDLVGGSGTESGRIFADDDVTSVTIHGSLIGGTSNESGSIESGSSIFGVNIGHNILGGQGAASAAITADTEVLLNVAVGGSIEAGAGAGSSRLSADAGVLFVSVKGSLIGNAANPLVIAAGGFTDATLPTSLQGIAISKITVGGRVEDTQILAGFNHELDAVNGHAFIGAVSVGGDWIASSMSAGIENLGTDDAPGGTGTAADNVNFGDDNDNPISGGLANVVAKIASITINGLVIGTDTSGDHFGFCARAIGSFKLGGEKITLPAQDADIPLSMTTGDVDIHVLATG